MPQNFMKYTVCNHKKYEYLSGGKLENPDNFLG